MGNNARNATINNCLFQDNKVLARYNDGNINLVCYANQKEYISLYFC